MTPFDYWDKPVEFMHLLWPQFPLYDKQKEICQSIVDNPETFVPAGGSRC